jgi:ketosteroid isomerase-like protein
MPLPSLPRRTLLRAGFCTFAGAVILPLAATPTVQAEPAAANEALIRKYYRSWEKKDWSLVDSILAQNFTFTSAAPDDHISKAAFKKQCWDTQSPLIEAFELERVVASENDAFVKYLCRTTNGKSFRNIEYHRLSGKKVQAIECYFGGPGYPSAANTGHS